MAPGQGSLDNQQVMGLGIHSSSSSSIATHSPSRPRTGENAVFRTPVLTLGGACGSTWVAGVHTAASSSQASSPGSIQAQVTLQQQFEKMKTVILEQASEKTTSAELLNPPVKALAHDAGKSLWAAVGNIAVPSTSTSPPGSTQSTVTPQQQLEFMRVADLHIAAPETSTSSSGSTQPTVTLQQQLEFMMIQNREQATRHEELVALLISQQQLFAAQQQSVVVLQTQVEVLTAKLTATCSTPSGIFPVLFPNSVAPQADLRNRDGGADAQAFELAAEDRAAVPVVVPHLPSVSMRPVL